MANREKGTAEADKYSSLIQVLVKPATKKELQTRAIIEGKTLSCLMRDVCEEEANKEYEVQCHVLNQPLDKPLDLFFLIMNMDLSMSL